MTRSHFIEILMILNKSVVDVGVRLTEYSVSAESVTLRFYCTTAYIPIAVFICGSKYIMPFAGLPLTYDPSFLALLNPSVWLLLQLFSLSHQLVLLFTSHLVRDILNSCFLSMHAQYSSSITLFFLFFF